MRFINIKELEPGMVLASEAVDLFGRILIVRDAVLTENYITKLDEMGISGLYIDDEISRDIEIKAPISPELRNESLIAVSHKDIDKCKIISKTIVEEMIANGTVGLDIQDLRTFDNYTYAHSVNVAVYACTVGLGLGLTEAELVDLVLAGLLHDLGKQDIPNEVLNKPGRLTPEEYALIKTHPEVSYHMIQERLDISSMVKNAVLCHHENSDGSGYPNGLTGENTTQLAKILHVVDTYDALTSKRPYKEPYSSFAAVQILEGGKGTLYDSDIVEAFLKYVPLYPKGTTIEIDGIVKGVVIENSGIHNLRPLVRLENMKEIDLSDKDNCSFTITMPSDLDYLSVVAEEEKRIEMIRKLDRYSVLIIDNSEETSKELTQKLSYLYDFTSIRLFSQLKTSIRKNGTPDLIVVDIDHCNFMDSNELANTVKIAPVLAVGMVQDIEVIKLLKRTGVKSYVLKPYRIIYMQSEIKRNLLPTTK